MSVRPIGHEDRLSLVEHLDELRKRLILCVIVFFLTFAFCYSQNDEILEIINDPIESTQNLDGKKRSQDPLEQSARQSIAIGNLAKKLIPALEAQRDLADALESERGLSNATKSAARQAQRDLALAARQAKTTAAATPTSRERQPVTLGVTEPFVTTFTVAGYAALLLALPFLLFQGYAFILPAFSPKEKKAALPLMLMVPVLFLLGVAFGYFVALPRAVEFLQNFNDDNFDILLQAKDYYRFAILFLAVMGMLFQIPVGVLAVTRLGIISTAQLRKNRGYVLLGVAVVAAVATPTPDPFTMLFTMAPLIVLFELSILLARVFEGRGEGRSSRFDDEDEDDDEDADDDADDAADDDKDPELD